jgi:hypothetical protein
MIYEQIVKMNKLKSKITEKQVLRDAINIFKTLTGSTVKELPLPEASNEIDALITINFADIEHQFNIEIKGEVRQSQVLEIIEQFGKSKDQWLLIARYIPQPLKDYFKSLSINYLELAGNCYINVKGIFIYVADQKVTPIREIAIGKLWKPTGLKFLMVIINNPELLNTSYRDIAMSAGVALGNIGSLLKELGHAGFIKKSGNVVILLNREKLVTRWTEMYHTTLRPRLIKGRFRFIRAEGAKEWKELASAGVYWGGEPGAALLTNHITPGHFTIYSDKSGNELLKMPGIFPDINGNITLLEKFWGQSHERKKNEQKDIKANAAPALLIYADLAHDLDSRNHEIAERVKKLCLNDK